MKAKVKFRHPNEFADEVKLRAEDVEGKTVRVTVERRRVPRTGAFAFTEVPDNTRAIDVVGTAVVDGQLFRLDVLIGVVVDIDKPSTKDKDVLSRAQMTVNNLTTRLEEDGFKIGGGIFEV